MSISDLNSVSSQLQQASNYHDLGGLNTLRQAAKKDGNAALGEAAKQFEAIFIQMMLKSMRKASDVLEDEDSPFNSEQSKFYRDMHDQQMALDMSQKGSLGLAELITQQLGQMPGFTPASVIRTDGNLDAARIYSHAQSTAEATPVGANVTMGTKQAAFTSQQDFIQQLLPLAEKAAAKLGVDPQALVAQAAVETGWGQFMIHSTEGDNGHNLFGIKADKQWSGDRTLVNTLEFNQGQPKRELAHFRAYNSFEDSLNDYVSFIQQSPRYQQALSNSQRPEEYFNGLQQGGYATDPEYAQKVLSVMGSSSFQKALSVE
ncbi:flagellar assembly peptidoglycan hydrolase FlgJ [Alteromonadaceae bacterium BrNp21-10]|nr:flagellar assembly peptidoglycan hydrolase FlgJ [Alteromonadaceae bacterium BrNp21-10]